LEPDPISGVVKGCKVICQPNELKEYGEGAKIVVVSEKLFSKLMSSLSEMEDDLHKLKELNVDQTIKNIEEVRGKIENHIKELSYSEYMDD
jgi:reverse gyrase